MSKVYILIQETRSPSGAVEKNILGLHSKLDATFYHIMRYNIMDKTSELKSGNEDSTFDIYAEERQLDSNKGVNCVYILADIDNSILKDTDLKMCMERYDDSGNVVTEPLSGTNEKYLKRIKKHTEIKKVISNFNSVYRNFKEDKEELKQRRQKQKIDDRLGTEEERFRIYQEQMVAFITMRKEGKKIPFPEFEQLTTKQLKNLSFSDYVKIKARQKDNMFQIGNSNKRMKRTV